MRRITQMAAIAAISAMGLVGCDRSPTATNTPAPTNTDSTAQNATNMTKNAVNNTGDAINSAAHKTGDAIGDAARATGNAVGSASTRASDLAQEARAKIGATTEPSDAVAADARSIRSGLATAVDDAVYTNSFAKFVGDFTEANRNRLSSGANQDFSDLDGIITAVRIDWKAKYGHDFKASADAFDSPAVMISEGGAPNITSDNSVGNVSTDRHNATVTFTSVGSSPVVVNLTKEGILGTWKINVPSSLDDMHLHDNLSRELTAVKDAKNNWPADENEAYRLVAQHIFAAATNIGGAQ